MLLQTSLIGATAKVFCDSPHKHLYCEPPPWSVCNHSRLARSASAWRPKWSGNIRPLEEAWERFPPNGHINAVNPQTHIRADSATASHPLQLLAKEQPSLSSQCLYPHEIIMSLLQCVEQKYPEGADRVVTWLNNSNDTAQDTEQQGEEIKPDHWLLKI